jgi:transcriptional repressor NrdR
VRQLESRGETELPSTVVGELVMKSLKALDEVAYVRYASVYRDFRETEDFARFLGDEGLNDEAASEDGAAPPLAQILLDGREDMKLNEVGSGSVSLDERIKI